MRQLIRTSGFTTVLLMLVLLAASAAGCSPKPTTASPSNTGDVFLADLRIGDTLDRAEELYNGILEEDTSLGMFDPAVFRKMQTRDQGLWLLVRKSDEKIMAIGVTSDKYDDRASFDVKINDKAQAAIERCDAQFTKFTRIPGSKGVYVITQADGSDIYLLLKWTPDPLTSESEIYGITLTKFVD